MQTNVTFKNIESSDALRQYAVKRLSKMDKYIDRTAEAHVVLSVEKRRHKADITLNADGTVINAVEITEDMYAALDMVMDKLERQLKKYKEKLQGKKSSAKAAAVESSAQASAARKRSPRLHRDREYSVKPMAVDEAVIELSTGKQDFVLFRETKSQRINLLYRRSDGELVLVEPQL